MGSRIACHFANIGVQVLLLDIAPKELNAEEEAKGLSLDSPLVKNRIVNNLEYMEELRTRDSLDLMTQHQKITFLEDRVRQLSKLERSYIPFEELSNEVKVNYETIDECVLDYVKANQLVTSTDDDE